MSYDGSNEVDLSGNATRSTWGGLAGFLGWLALGLLVYFLYGFRNSRLREQRGVQPCSQD